MVRIKHLIGFSKSVQKLYFGSVIVELKYIAQFARKIWILGSKSGSDEKSRNLSSYLKLATSIPLENFFDILVNFPSLCSFWSF